jgi:hypothetical protein
MLPPRKTGATFENLHQTHNNQQMTALKIPYDQLNPEALQGVIEEFVTRDGMTMEKLKCL